MKETSTECYQVIVETNGGFTHKLITKDIGRVRDFIAFINQCPDRLVNVEDWFETEDKLLYLKAENIASVFIEEGKRRVTINE